MRLDHLLSKEEISRWMCFAVELSLEGGCCACTSGQSPSVAAEPLMNPIKKELRKASFPHSFPMRFALTTDNEDFRRRCAWGKHPYPSRTRRLRPRRPMVLHWRRCGRAGGCRNPKRRGCSSVGRAPALQAGGREFESLHLHWMGL